MKRRGWSVLLFLAAFGGVGCPSEEPPEALAVYVGELPSCVDYEVTIATTICLLDAPGAGKHSEVLRVAIFLQSDGPQRCTLLSGRTEVKGMNFTKGDVWLEGPFRCGVNEALYLRTEQFEDVRVRVVYRIVEEGS
jgi:hypothetical protein